MDLEKYIRDNNLNYNNISEKDFIFYYGSTLADMMQFGTNSIDEEKEGNFDIIDEGNSSFYEILKEYMYKLLESKCLFLISEDSEEDVYLLMDIFTSEQIEKIHFLAKKHQMNYEIGPSVLDIKFTQCWFYKKVQSGI